MLTDIATQAHTVIAVAFCSRWSGALCCILPRSQYKRSAMSWHAAAVVVLSLRRYATCATSQTVRRVCTLGRSHGTTGFWECRLRACTAGCVHARACESRDCRMHDCRRTGR